MSFTSRQIKSILSNYGTPLENLDAAADEICGRHKADLDGIKEERDEYREKLNGFDQMKADFETAKSDLKAAQDALKSAEPYKAKYEKEHADFEAFKADAAGKESKAKANEALTKLLTEQGYSATGIAKIVKYGGLTPEFDNDGNITNADTIMQSVGAEWGEYHNSPVKTEGVQTAQPPATKPSGMTKEDIMKITDPAERINAIKANPELFGISKKE